MFSVVLTAVTDGDPAETTGAVLSLGLFFAREEGVVPSLAKSPIIDIEAPLPTDVHPFLRAVQGAPHVRTFGTISAGRDTGGLWAVLVVQAVLADLEPARTNRVQDAISSGTIRRIGAGLAM
jgi:hypothetical protein